MRAQFFFRKGDRDYRSLGILSLEYLPPRGGTLFMEVDGEVVRVKVDSVRRVAARPPSLFVTANNKVLHPSGLNG